MASVTATRPARVRKDTFLLDAVDVALAAAQTVADRPNHVGDHEHAVTVAERFVEHRFACTMPGYRGWHWTVTLARIPRSRKATVCEVELLPGSDALLAPEWLPWSERLRPGDIGPGDVLPFKADDPRLEPGFTPTGDETVDSVAIEELALARTRVLSQDGISEAAQRWYDSDAGPRSAGAIASTADCMSCGFLVPLQGSLGQVFGVCANPWSPDDGRVVALEHGCGAHSETDVDAHGSDWPDKDHVIDENRLDLVGSPATERPRRKPTRTRTRGGKPIVDPAETATTETATTDAAAADVASTAPVTANAATSQALAPDTAAAAPDATTTPAAAPDAAPDSVTSDSAAPDAAADTPAPPATS